MPRWSSDADRRLVDAALELFAEKGYDATTVADIAARAGLQKRSFFRYFRDKREVLFSGTDGLMSHLRTVLEAQPPDAEVWDSLMHTLTTSADIVTADRALARTRRAVIEQTPELRERDVLKATQLAEVLEDLLVRRGVPSPRSRMLARLTMLVYEEAFDAWLESGDPFAACIAAAQQRLTDALVLAALPRSGA